MNASFWKGKKVLVTGHTGFKGTWLIIWLNKMGAKITGYALKEYDNDKFFRDSGIGNNIADERGDIQDFERLKKVFDKHKPEIVFHLAAQPIVRKSYDEPLETIRTNVMGTTNVLECIRLSESVKVGVIITSDKCYDNKEWHWGYRETDHLGGHDPYSATKGCAEILVRSYRESFFKKLDKGVKLVSTARAGNVIGGADYSKDRLIPDCIKALMNKKVIELRNPKSTRPWQHVLEPLSGYLLLAEKMWTEKKHDESWNFGPHLESVKPVHEVAQKIVKLWGEGEIRHTGSDDKKQESCALSLDISKSYFVLDWKPKLSLDEALAYTVEWHKKCENASPTEIIKMTEKQIDSYTKKQKR